MIIGGIHYLPILLFILFPATFFGCYIAAVLQGHVEAEFPYISDTGTYSPESCIFGQLINFGAVLLSLLVYIRYCEVYQFFELYSGSHKILHLNKIGIYSGIIACIGLSIVANFQETNVIYVHYVGACLCFGCGTIYFWVQAVCSYHMHPLANSLLLAHCRVALAFICTVFYILVPVAGLISRLQYHGKNPRKWFPDDGGWVLHVVSTASEWVVAICFCFFILSFYSEFSLMKFSHPKPGFILLFRLNPHTRPPYSF